MNQKTIADKNKVMKKIFLLMTLSAFLLVACDKEKVVQSTDLPPNASGFVSTHYSGNQILQVVKELDNLKTYFHVYLFTCLEQKKRVF